MFKLFISRTDNEPLINTALLSEGNEGYALLDEARLKLNDYCINNVEVVHLIKNIELNLSEQDARKFGEAYKHYNNVYLYVKHGDTRYSEVLSYTFEDSMCDNVARKVYTLHVDKVIEIAVKHAQELENKTW